jgi:hypothetical protein
MGKVKTTLEVKMDDILEQFKKESTDALDRIRDNKHILFDILDANKIESATAEFEGSGDSGGIEYTNLEPEDPKDEPKAKALMDENVIGAKILLGTMYGPEGSSYQFETGPVTVKDLLEALCYDALAATHRGWENNEGAKGSFLFEPKDRTISLEFYALSTELHEHEF